MTVSLFPLLKSSVYCMRELKKRADLFTRLLFVFIFLSSIFWEVGPFSVLNHVGHWCNSWFTAMWAIFYCRQVLGHFGLQFHSIFFIQALTVVVCPWLHHLWHQRNALCWAFLASSRRDALCCSADRSFSTAVQITWLHPPEWQHTHTVFRSLS